MDSVEQFVSLDTLAQGGAIELFGDELKRVLENIQDPNTNASAVREIALSVKIKPDDQRQFGVVLVQVKSKICPNKNLATTFYFGRKGGQAVALEHNPNQPQLPLDNVAEIGGKR